MGGSFGPVVQGGDSYGEVVSSNPEAGWIFYHFNSPQKLFIWK